MTEPVTLTIHYDVGRVSPNKRLHPFERARRISDFKLAAICAWNKAGYPESDRPVRVDILLRRARALDADNAVACCKGWDAIMNRKKYGRGITMDDSPRWLTLGRVDQEIAKTWKGKEQLVLTVTPLEEESP